MMEETNKNMQNTSKIILTTGKDIKICYSVYKHTCPNGKVYIGITSQTPTRRWRNGDGYKNKQQLFYRAILKYGWENIKHEILCENLHKEEAEKMEIDLIARYKSNQKEFGYNIENGGNSIGKISESTKEKLRNANLGKKASEETKRKISESNKGKHRNITKETRNKMVLSRKKNGNYEPWNKGKTLLGVPVIKLDLQGNEIKKYTSIHSAQLDTGSTHVRECCEGKRKIDKGFMWKYAE